MKIQRFFNSLSLTTITPASLLTCNEKLHEHGLCLTHEEAKTILANRTAVLSQQARVDISLKPTELIIKTFCESSYISQETFALVISQLLEIFYYYRNHCRSTTGDVEIISHLYELFNTTCGGSIDALRGKVSDKEFFLEEGAHHESANY